MNLTSIKDRGSHILNIRRREDEDVLEWPAMLARLFCLRRMLCGPFSAILGKVPRPARPMTCDQAQGQILTWVKDCGAKKRPFKVNSTPAQHLRLPSSR